MFSFSLNGLTISESVTGETLQTLIRKEDNFFCQFDHHWAEVLCSKNDLYLDQ